MNAELAIAVQMVKIDHALPLDEKVKAAMRYVRNNESEVFFMCGRLDDDFRMRTALGAVLTKASDDEKDIITRSLKPLQMLAAAAQGIPVDFSAFAIGDDLLPLLGMWHETEAA